MRLSALAAHVQRPEHLWNGLVGGDLDGFVRSTASTRLPA
jgi:hypothetical protein